MKFFMGIGPAILEAIKNIPNLFTAAVKKAFIILKHTFKMVWKFIRKLFTKTIRAFIKTMKGLMRATLSALRMLWRMI